MPCSSSASSLFQHLTNFSPKMWKCKIQELKILTAKSERIAPLLSTPRSLVKTKDVHAKFEAEEDSIHEHGKSCFFPRKEHDEKFRKQEEIFGVCLPSASAWASSLDSRASKQLDYRGVNAFFILSPFVCFFLSLSLPCMHRLNSAQCDSSLHCYAYQSTGPRMRSCCRRCSVCANREGRSTRLQRDDRIMMSSENISASSLNPQILFSSSTHSRNRHSPFILCSKLTPT